jgi:hypothetical protein
VIDLDATVLAAGMDAFGEFVTWTPAGRSAQTVPAVFWANAVETKFDGDVEIEEITTYLSLRLSQMNGTPAQGDAFTVRGVAYVASEIKPDGAGGCQARIRFVNDAQTAVQPTAPNPVAP